MPWIVAWAGSQGRTLLRHQHALGIAFRVVDLFCFLLVSLDCLIPKCHGAQSGAFCFYLHRSATAKSTSSCLGIFRVLAQRALISSAEYLPLSLMLGGALLLFTVTPVCGHYRTFCARPPLIQHKELWRSKDWASGLAAIAHRRVLVMVNFSWQHG